MEKAAVPKKTEDQIPDLKQNIIPYMERKYRTICLKMTVNTVTLIKSFQRIANRNSASIVATSLKRNLFLLLSG
jgi:hypothetical protein